MGLGDLNPVRIVEGKGAIGESGLGGLVIGAGLAAMGVPPMMAGLYTGGASALLTGDLKQGLFMGMGAYGGAGLMGGLGALGESTLADQALNSSIDAKLAGVEQLGGPGLESSVQGFTSPEVAGAGPTQLSGPGAPATPAPSPIAADKIALPQTTTAAPGLEGATQRLSNAGQGLNTLTGKGGLDALSAQMAASGGPSLGMAAGMGAAGILGTYQQPNPAAGVKQDPGYIRQFAYNPIGQRYTAMTPVKADQWGSRSFQDAFRAADGGIVALAHGGAVQHFDAGGMPQDINSLYQTVLGRAPDTGGAEYWAKQFGDTIDANELATFKGAAQAELNNTAPQLISNIYENVLGRNVDPSGAEYWTKQLTSGESNPGQVYANILAAAKQNTELGNFGLDYNQATTPYTGYASSDTGNIADEWAQNVLGRGLTEADKRQQWYKDATSAAVMNSPVAAQKIYGQFQDYAKGIGATETADRVAQARQVMAQKGLTDADVKAQTGKTVEELVGAPKTDLDVWHASQLTAPGAAFNFGSLTGKQKAAMMGATTPLTTPGDITKNKDGTSTVTPNIPGRPAGGFTGMQQVKDIYTQGGGSLGYTPYVPKTAAEHAAMYDKQTGGSRAAYDYLMGKSAYPIAPATATGEVMKPYGESVLGAPVDTKAKALIWDPKARRYIPNPQYVKPLTIEEKAAAEEKAKADAAAKSVVDDFNLANGGLTALAAGGLGSLGGYSDGGRLLKGPGDGVSDSIPASIGDRQPARLADGEFVIPARIVSELGNGSTDAGARKLYAMMDRVQKARGKTTGKGKVATNSRADKYLPV